MAISEASEAQQPGALPQPVKNRANHRLKVDQAHDGALSVNL